MWAPVSLLYSSVLLEIIQILVLDRGGRIHNTDFNFPLISKQQIAFISVFRESVSDVADEDFEKTDEYLLRWLEACDMNLSEAEKMFRDAKKWRIHNNMSTILNESILDLEFCYYSSGIAKNGGAVCIVKPSAGLEVDIRKMLITGLREKLLRVAYQCMELTLTKSIEMGKAKGKGPIPGVVIIQSVKFNVKQHGCWSCTEFYREVMSVASLYYPLNSKYIVVLNSPALSKAVYEVVKPVFSNHVKNALKVFGFDKKEWSSFLLNIISANELPEEYGGSNSRPVLPYKVPVNLDRNDSVI